MVARENGQTRHPTTRVAQRRPLFDGARSAAERIRAHNEHNDGMEPTLRGLPLIRGCNDH